MSTHDDPFRSLDERARAAATDLHARAADHPIPTFDPGHAVVALPAARPAGRGRMLAVAAVVLVVAAIAGLLVAQSGDDGDDKAKVISSDPRPFVAKDLPPGFALAGVGEIDATKPRPTEGDVGSMSPLTLYGPSADDPQLGIAAFGDWEGAVGGEEIDLGGRTAYRYDRQGLGEHAVILPEEGRAIVLVTTEADPGWLDDLAAAVTSDDQLGIDLNGFDLPAGWHELAQLPDLLSLSSPAMTMSPAASGSYALYLTDGVTVSSSESSSGSSSESGDPDDGGQAAPDQLLPDPATLTVSSTAGAIAEVHATELVAADAEEVTVRGHDALLTRATIGDDTAGPWFTVSWLERPGEVLRVSGIGVTEDEVLAAAEGVTPVEPAEWKDLVERTQLGEFDPANAGDPTKTKVGEGRFADGTRWTLTASEPEDPEVSDPSADLSVTIDDGTSSGESSISGLGAGLDGSDPTALLTLEVMATGGKTFLSALVGPDVARAELVDADGGRVADGEIVEGGGFRGIVALLGTEERTLVLLDADGTELGRIALERPEDADSGSSSSGSSSSGGSSSSSGSGSSGN